MNTLKKTLANQAETAKKQMGDIAQNVKVPTEINENEKHLYHVLMVEAQFNPATLKTKYKSRVQVYNYKSWLTVKGRLKQIGEGHAYIIHDPKQDTESKEEVLKGEAQEATKKEKGGKKKSEAQDKRQALIDEAKSLGYEGALNVKNAIFEEFIKNAKENGESDENGGEE